jgi:hypothetical protein
MTIVPGNANGCWLERLVFVAITATHISTARSPIDDELGHRLRLHHAAAAFIDSGNLILTAIP